MASTTSLHTPAAAAVERIDRELPQVSALIASLVAEFGPDGPHPDTYEGLTLTALRQRRYLLLNDRERYVSGGYRDPFARLPQPSDDGGF